MSINSEILVSSIFPKNKRKQVDFRYHSDSRSNFFVHFLEEFRIPTSPFEIK